MKNFTKNIVTLVSTLAFAGVVQAEQLSVDKNQIQQEIAFSLHTAVSDINKPVVAEIAKVQLDKMALLQNIEQSLSLAKSNLDTINQETTAAKVEVIAE